MADFGLTSEGFVLKGLEDILADTREAAANVFGDLVSAGDVVDTSDSSTLGRLINLDAEGDAELWEAAQQSYSILDPNTATGIALDNLVEYGGLSRLSESFSTVPLLLKGDFNTNIAADSLVESPTTSQRYKTSSLVSLDLDDAVGLDIEVASVQNSTLYSITFTSAANGTDVVEFTSDSDATAAEIIAGLQSEIVNSHSELTATVSGSTTLVVTTTDTFQLTDFVLSANLFATKSVKLVTGVAITAGPISALPNTISQIVTPILGWDSVDNPVAATEGRFRETDEELRLRFQSQKFTQGSNTVDSIISEITPLDGIAEVFVYENDTNATDANGIPAHSFLTIVDGGIQQEIANAIYINKPVGIQAFGNITIQVPDSQGVLHDISFSRPTSVSIDVELTLTKDSEFPGDGEDQIRQAIIDYAADNLGVGEDVLISRLYTPANTVPGHSIDLLRIGFTSGSLGTSNLTIDFDEKASFTVANITFV